MFKNGIKFFEIPIKDCKESLEDIIELRTN